MADTKHSQESTQREKFESLARELECDEDEVAFDERLKRVATAPKKEKADGEA
jgi:hypothetical protein